MNGLKRTSAFDVAPRFFDSFLLKDLLNVPATTNNGTKALNHLPAVNVFVNEEGYTLEVVAPGLVKENFKISFENGLLIVSYQEENKTEENTENAEKGQYLLREFKSRAFSRSFTFPKGVIDEEKVAASYQDGILRLTLAKREEAKPKAPRQINVS